MPRQKKSTQATQNSDDDEDTLQSQSLTQAERAIASFSQEEVERRINEIVQYMLIMDSKRIPIKKLEINKNILKEQSRGFDAMFLQAKQRLKNVFGIDVLEVDSSKQKSYILVNRFWTDPDQDKTHLKWSDEDHQKTGLLLIVLSIIFMNGNVAPDTLMWHTLKKLGLDIEKTHLVFGDIKKLITQEFVRQAYIEYIRNPQSDPPSYELKWGPRAALETTKRKVLQFVCRIYGDDIHLEHWRMQYQEVLQEEEAANAATSS
ncbi:non-structural maintenance of chromosomes element 3 homolog [Tubulanus polymorphus]|uniref:non-structural maintenance of chromosomes element 3 homolog n=1 Tax=Tubulanus polymorphus TaxID=672921 RepID=UPI003DA48A3E